MITLSPRAVTQLKEMLSTGDASRGLRLHIDKGGCAGWQYVIKLDAAGDKDQVFSQDGVSVIIDDESLKLLNGSSIDYVDNLNDAGFKIENPNATRSCGCGTSFEPKAAQTKLFS
jgi:iron-sulfur cluster assembly protein